ncbi:MAG: dihydroorotase [Actinomycetota bacterium]|nr:dihydroorotase [Actinomycetota bacterium]
MSARIAGAVVVRGGEVVSATGTRRADVLVGDGIVQTIEESLEAPSGALVLDAGGCLVAPALVDLHTHLREPGAEQAETVESGSRAAALGGYSAVVAMPNTTPAIDCASVVRDVRALAETALVDVAVAGAITVGRAGERLVPFAELAGLGVRLFTDDGTGVQDAALLRRALEYAGDLGVILAEHCEDASLAKGGLMHEGSWSSRLGVPGQPALAEEAMLARDLALVRLTGTPMHFLHLSTAGSMRLFAAARAEGLPVTAEVTPHHLSLTDAELASFDPLFKVNPPLRGEDDVAALRRACADGLIDAIATDHAPHPQEAKEAPLEDAPPGMLGLETALSVAWEALVAPGHVSAARLFSLLSGQPARIAGLESSHGGPIAPGRPAQLCVFDPAERVLVEPERLASRSANTPFAGRSLTGKVRHTLVHGEPVVIDGKAQR